MPSVGQGFYWLGSSINYNLSIILILIFYLVYKRLNEVHDNKHRVIYFLICLLLSVAIAGFNEVAALIFLISIIILLSKNLVVDKKFNLLLTITLILNLISVYIAFTAPGNSGRSVHYAGNHDFFNSFFTSVTFLLSRYFYGCLIHL